MNMRISAFVATAALAGVAFAGGELTVGAGSMIGIQKVEGASGGTTWKRAKMNVAWSNAELGTPLGDALTVSNLVTVGLMPNDSVNTDDPVVDELDTWKFLGLGLGWKFVPVYDERGFQITPSDPVWKFADLVRLPVGTEITLSRGKVGGVQNKNDLYFVGKLNNEVRAGTVNYPVTSRLFNVSDHAINLAAITEGCVEGDRVMIEGDTRVWEFRMADEDGKLEWGYESQPERRVWESQPPFFDYEDWTYYPAVWEYPDQIDIPVGCYFDYMSKGGAPSFEK